MKTNNPGPFFFLSVPRIFILGISAVFILPEPASAQSTSQPKVEVQFSDYIYQGGRKRSSRGIRLTTSSVRLPDLNAILSTTPLPKTTQPVENKKVVEKSNLSAQANSKVPRFGYGSGPVEPPAPADPGFQPALAAHQQPVQQPTYTQPSVQIRHTTTIPFSHGYYPRTYVPSIPFIYPHGNHYHYGYPGCGIYPSRSPLRGSLTSSRNYLSGFRSLRFSF